MVYVIMTFLFFFHMGRVEWVTCQGPVRKVAVGAWKGGGLEGVWAVEGGRKMRGDGFESVVTLVVLVVVMTDVLFSFLAKLRGFSEG